MDFEIIKARENVKRALDVSSEWRAEAHNDYAFLQGKQWSDADKAKLDKAGRPCITINRIRPVINLLCGYAAQNETEPDFLPRSNEDERISRVAKGVTKYALDKTNYQREKKKVFRDVVTCGLGAYWVNYNFDYDRLDGVITIERLSPFDVFKDPESIKEDLSDAQFCGRYSWETKEKLSQVYPDKVVEIAGLYHKYDDSEMKTIETQSTWYNKELKKVRTVQYWYKEYTTKKVIVLGDKVITDANKEQYLAALLQGVKPREIPDVKIRYATFCDDVLLEEGESPFEHKRFPLVLQYCYYSGETIDNSMLEPAGVVRDIKDAQRELNKNRSQRMHVVNQQSLGVKFWQGQIDENIKKTIKEQSTTPGANIFLPQGVTWTDGTPAYQGSENIQLEQQSSNDFYSISGITPESLSGNLGAMSGKAIDLRQSVTTVQTADIFDKAKEAERIICQLLWGENGRKGLIPQYYNQKKVLRILGDDGQKEFVSIEPGLNKPMEEQIVTNQFGVPVQDEHGNPVTQVLYDLSAFDFDIVITTSMASATARKANLYQLLEAKKSGVDIPMDIILDFMDFPEKETVKKRLQQASEQPSMPEIKLSGGIDDLPADALSQALQSIGVNIPAEKIMQERLALKGRANQIVPQPTIQEQLQPHY